ncbi:hypothetical protein EC973_006569 [Apophysomyces ossiformis]|uniref:Uncharacterized protein n=1 Tax=Apophysomyces ossiformis TaxID=679940 RepID=A0A8H7BW63_9FUNG|nr:hypothetical protein EC973_006569 [Apophysomyces ossiformis]
MVWCVTYLCQPKNSEPAEEALCNGFAKYRDIPANEFFYLGAYLGGSGCGDAAQDRNVTTMLNDGTSLLDASGKYRRVRLFDIELCARDKKPHLCTSANLPLHDWMDELFEFVRLQSRQLVVVHLKSHQDISLKQFEDVVDEICQLHSERTLGTDLFEKRKCQFIHIQPQAPRPWPSIGDIVEYYPEMAQWEGDGEDVGVQSKIIFTYEADIANLKNDKPSYFSPTFWKASRRLGQQTEDLHEQLQYMCKTKGAIYLRAYPDTNTKDCLADEKIYDPYFLENAIAGPTGCNLLDKPAAGTLNAITMASYHKHLEYLRDIQKRMMHVNYEKFLGHTKKLDASSLVNIKSRQEEHVRDEL